MKAIKFYAIIATLALITTSCVENSGKYKTVVAQRDSLELEKQALDSSYNHTIALLNDIEAGFSEINQNEKQVKINLNGEGSETNKRKLIGTQMKAIKDGIENNKAKIAELRNLAAKRGKSNNMLDATIKRLQSQMDEKNTQIQSLQAELNLKNIKIDELNTTVTDQSKNIVEQQNVLEQQESTIKVQETNINMVWYCVASSKKLKEAKIISGGGLFQSTKVLVKDFDNKAFTQVDLRTTSSISTSSRNAKILSLHPKNSYKLVTGANKNITIQITNPTKFWSVSKYLVVQI